MISIYKIKPQFQALLRPILEQMHKKGIQPNTITWMAILLSVLCGLFCWMHPILISLIILPIALFIRMALNALDGMMARTYQLQSKGGEMLNEIGDVPGALSKVNEVRARVKMPALQQTDATKPTHVISQTAARDRIRNERRYEFINEGVNYFDEIRWRTWKTSVFTNNGLQSVWGQRNTTYTWGGDHFYVWPIPQSEIQINNKLTQNPGWPN